MSSQLDAGRMDPAANRGRLMGRAIVAGIIGGILIDLYLFAVHAAPFPGIYQYVSSALVGKAAFASPSYIWLGLAIHFAVAIGWALLYAYAVSAMHAARRWVVGGLVLGVVVMIVMMIVQMVLKMAPPLTTRNLVINLVGHVVFYGWPVAAYLAWGVMPKGIAQLGLNVPKGE